MEDRLSSQLIRSSRQQIESSLNGANPTICSPESDSTNDRSKTILDYSNTNDSQNKSKKQHLGS